MVRLNAPSTLPQRRLPTYHQQDYRKAAANYAALHINSYTVQIGLVFLRRPMSAFGPLWDIC
jgi:hypothetical protein